MSPTQKTLRDRLSTLADAALLQSLRDSVGRSHVLTAELLVHLAEVDDRRLYAELGHSSLFAYCTEALAFSRDVAGRRIRVARLGRRFPRVVDLVATGRIHLAGLSVLAPHLTDDNHQALLDESEGKTRDAIERLLAARDPRPDVPDSVRKLPKPRQSTPAHEPVPIPRSVPMPLPVPVPLPETRPQPRPEPLSEDRYKVTFTASAALIEKLDAVKDLLAHAVPEGDTAEVVERALDALHEQLLKRKRGSTSAKAPEEPREPEPTADARPRTRYIPAHVRRAVWERDGGRCTFVGAHGRCTETRRLEFQHRVPFALGGAHTPANVCLLCRGHNDLAARHDFGSRYMDRFTRTPQHAPGRTT